ncbi:hypothetical protein SAMN05216304_10656 [Bosea sp. OK403]|uniref:hypothetical protein n=1 Tax=Bosea sp. OK403 TaxID=1855286 RepID=UPI0008F07DB6|nr:hypothetical protein [Bosea sp. OK403]SFJ26537.1 hypothetical protein SAMN05216304_10656 [Bosea sp. OK403]
MQTLFGFDLSTGQKWIIAFAVILALLALLGLFARQIKGGRLRMRGQGGGRARQPRLGVVDIHDLDRQRQLILIRRDNVEHLIMIGGVSDIVVETNILRSGGRAATALPTEVPATERPGAFEALPPAEAVRQDTRQEQPTLERLPIRSIPGGAPSRPAQQGATQAEAPAAVAAAVVLPSLAAAATQMPAPVVQPPSFTRDFSPSQSASAVELDSMAQQLEEALKRPHSAVRPANAPAEPPRLQSEPKPPVEPVVEPPFIAPAMPTPTPPAPPETAGRPIPLPADVEAELEMALGLRPERVVPKAPAVTVTAKPAPVAPPPAPPVPEPVMEREPVKAAPAKSEPAAVAEQAPSDDIDDSFLEAPTKPAEPAPVPEHKHEASTAPEPRKPASEPEPAFKPEPKPEPKPDPKPEAAPEPKPAAIDPFSVDAIEAEFARLLGRDPKPKS